MVVEVVVVVVVGVGVGGEGWGWCQRTSGGGHGHLLDVVHRGVRGDLLRVNGDHLHHRCK